MFWRHTLLWPSGLKSEPWRKSALIAAWLTLWHWHNMYLWNTGKLLPNYAQYHQRQNSSQSLQWELQISYFWKCFPLYTVMRSSSESLHFLYNKQCDMIAGSQKSRTRRDGRCKATAWQTRFCDNEYTFKDEELLKWCFLHIPCQGYITRTDTEN
jgi:hypothetical protein